MIDYTDIRIEKSCEKMIGIAEKIIEVINSNDISTLEAKLICIAIRDSLDVLIKNNLEVRI